MFDGEAAYEVAFWPDNGEYANTTRFLTDYDYRRYLRIEIIPRRVTELALFTDGLQMLALDFTMARVHDRFFAPLFKTLRTGPSEEMLRTSLMDFMDSKRVNDRTDDDKTLLLATRIRWPSQALPTQLRDHLGNEVRPAPKPFAVGGEGAVYDVQGHPELVAKLYSKPQSKERCDKLRAMAKLCSPDLLKIAAWPTAVLHSTNPSVIDGILMPKVAGYLEIHHLYSVAQRKKDFPEADWGFLLHTAP